MCLLGVVAVLGVPVGFGILFYGMMFESEFMWRAGMLLMMGTVILWILLIFGVPGGNRKS